MVLALSEHGGLDPGQPAGALYADAIGAQTNTRVLHRQHQEPEHPKGLRKAWRLAALLEAAVWVAGGQLVVTALGLLPHVPVGFAVYGSTIAGGALLGLGAYVNRACVFGAIAALAQANWLTR